LFRAAPLEIPQRGISRFEKLLALTDFALRSEPCPLEFSRCCPNQPNPPAELEMDKALKDFKQKIGDVSIFSGMAWVVLSSM
jgi:hypothetical protein